MAETMDDSFRVRVEKIFGSLTSSSSCHPPSSLQSTLWSLTDEEVERREWRRRTTAASFVADRDEIPCGSSFDEIKNDRRRRRNQRKNELENDLGDEVCDGDGDQANRSRRGGDNGLDEWEIRSSIGLDRTLDNEEEEDEYDKVASGRENAGDRLYMKNVTDHGSYLNFHNMLPNSLHGTKDPRANRLAAKIRLQEDAAEARKLPSHSDSDRELKEQCIRASYGGGGQVRSILKRKDSNSDSKSNKRVRFDPGCKIVSEEEDVEKTGGISMGNSIVNVAVSEDGHLSGQNASGVPDYLRNPSNYTCYSFDSSGEVDEKSNTQAFMDFLKFKTSKPGESGSQAEDASAELPKSVTFIPKKKAGEVKAVTNSSKDKQEERDNRNQSMVHKGFPAGIAAGETEGSGVGAMEEDEEEKNAVQRSAIFQKPGRNYRSKSSADDFDV